MPRSCSTRTTARQLLATALGRAAELGGDRRPVVPDGAEVGDPPLLVREPLAELLEQLATRGQSARRLDVAGDAPRLEVQVADSTHIPTLPLVVPRLFGDLVRAIPTSSRMSCGGSSRSKSPTAALAKKLARTDWQMSIESNTRRKRRVAEPEPRPHLQPDLRLVAADQLHRRLLVALADAGG